jgi:hypothetical protein
MCRQAAAAACRLAGCSGRVKGCSTTSGGSCAERSHNKSLQTTTAMRPSTVHLLVPRSSARLFRLPNGRVGRRRPRHETDRALPCNAYAPGTQSPLLRSCYDAAGREPMTKHTTKPEPSSAPWWLLGEEECPHCGLLYIYELEFRCPDCDSPSCMHCVSIHAEGRTVCVSCVVGCQDT